MKTVVFAYHLLGVRCLESLLRLKAQIPLVVTHLDQPNEEIWFPCVRDLAERNGLEVQTPEDPNEHSFVEKIRRIAPGAIFSFYYRKILSQDILRCAQKGAFNLHGSLLPKYRGRCPVNWVLINGEKVTGVTLHEMVRQPDAGDIVMQREVPIEEKDTAYTLFGKIADVAARVVEDFFPLLEKGTFQKISQDHSRATVFGARRPQDGAFSWDQDARCIYNFVRALTHPYPGAFTAFGGKNLWIWWAQPYVGAFSAKATPGTILSLKNGLGIAVATGKGALLVKRVQWAGEEEKGADVFAKEKRFEVGDRLL